MKRGRTAALAAWMRPRVVRALESAGLDRVWRRPPPIVAQLRRLARPAPAAGGPRVLVMSFRGAWLLHGAWEALIAEALRRRGAQPTLFVCSGGLPETLPGKSPACGIAGIHSGPTSCVNCTRCGMSIAGSLRLPALRLDDVVGAREARDLMAPIDALGYPELVALRHRGVLIGQYIRNSARWFLCVSDLAKAPEGTSVLRAFAKSALVVAEAAPRLLDRIRPEAVLLLNGLFFAERIVKEEAARRGIRVLSYERGFMPDTLCFSHGIPGYYDIAALWARVRDVPLLPPQEAQLDEYLQDRRKGRRAPFDYWPILTEDRRQVVEELRLDPERPIATLFTNITWDSAAQDRDRAFPDMYAWVRESIRLFGERPEWQLVVRVHPAEVRVPFWETRDPIVGRLRADAVELPPNVRIVAPESDLSSYTLMDVSRAGLVYSSTAGLEMAMDGTPVVVAGEVHYAGKGFTLDAESPDDYGCKLDAALQGPRRQEVRELARRYAHAFFFRYFLPFPLVSENPPDFIPTLNADDPAQLDAGGDATLDLVCRAILQGTEPVGVG